jgi:hypothetical protein
MESFDVMYNRINIMLPTYKRVNNGRLLRHLESSCRLVSNPKNVCYTFLYTPGDKETQEFFYNLCCKKGFDFEGKHIEFPFAYKEISDSDPKNLNLGRFYNQMYKETRFKDPGTLVSLVGDDMVWLTKDFDVHILNKINEVGGRGLIYCNDNYIARDRCMVNMFTSRQLIEATERPFLHEGFSADHHDVIYTEIGKALNIAYYLPNVILDHQHNRKLPKDQWDETRNRLVIEIQKSRENKGLIEPFVKEVVEILKAKGVYNEG